MNGISQDFLTEFEACLRRRKRALNRKIQFVDTRIFLQLNSEAWEKVEVLLTTDGSRTAHHILLTVWEDRWVHLDMRQGSKNGWKWELTVEGRYFDADGPTGLLEMVEKTASKILSAPKSLNGINQMWSTKLATGPCQAQ